MTRKQAEAIKWWTDVCTRFSIPEDRWLELDEAIDAGPPRAISKTTRDALDRLRDRLQIADRFEQEGRQ